MRVRPITPLEHDILTLQDRYEYTTRLLGVTPVSRSVFRAMYLDNKGWTIAAMSRKVGAARGTVTAIADLNIEAGYIDTKAKKIYISKSASKLLIQAHRETIKISTGNQKGFSKRLIRFYRDLDENRISAKASTVCFPKNLLELK